MDRRVFIKGMGAAGFMVTVWPGINPAVAMESMSPMGKALGPDQTLLVFNAKLVDVVKAALFDETAILIRGGHIEKRVPASEVAQTNADRKINAGGRYLIPGLINTHCHVSLPTLGKPSLGLIMGWSEQVDFNFVNCVQNGVTTIRDAMGNFNSIGKRMERIARGELLGPRVLRAFSIDVKGGYMASMAKFIKNSGAVAANAAEVRDAVARAIDLGADQIKTALQDKSLMVDLTPIPQMSDEMFVAAVEKATSLGKYVMVHHTSLKGFRKALRTGVQSFEHMSSDEPLTDADIQGFKDAGRAVIPTGSVAWALVFPRKGDANFDSPIVQKIWKHKQEHIHEEISAHAIPKIAKVSEKSYAELSSPGFYDKPLKGFIPSAEFFNASGAIGGANMMRMYEAGCKMGCGNDGGIPFIWPGSFPLEMRLNEAAGMKPGDVLRSATIVNAEIIQMKDKIGSLDTGKFADIVFLDANPLDSMDAIEKPAAVLQSGRLTHSVGAVKVSSAG